MASKFLHEAQRGAGGGSIDLPLALLAGLAVGFAAFVIPPDLLASGVEASGLPSILPAAAPPLGTKAQGLLAVAAAGVTFTAVFLLLRMLGGKTEPDRARDLDEPEYQAPRLRRSDVHPDAPSRRPILAARELGEPAPAASAAAAPTPFWGPEDFPAEPEAECVKAEPEVQEEEALDLDGPGIEMLEPVEPASAPGASVAGLAQEGERATVPPAPVEPDEPVGPVDGASIADLMARLERGLARRLQQQVAVAAPPTAPAPAPPSPARGFAAADGGDDRLRSAIENLQKMAARAR